mmetsp:Transcript_12505/g.45598  ORF Transcript_12505/g.45598 Transcript_12505/m.45598 type:complete len:613 (-) Transcript_12505:2254-4092(-)
MKMRRNSSGNYNGNAGSTTEFNVAPSSSFRQREVPRKYEEEEIVLPSDAVLVRPPSPRRSGSSDSVGSWADQGLHSSYASRHKSNSSADIQSAGHNRMSGLTNFAGMQSAIMATQSSLTGSGRFTSDRMKVMVSRYGTPVRSEKGWTYDGGETRIIEVHLSDSLDDVVKKIGLSPPGEELRYELPGQCDGPAPLVTLNSEDDLRFMFDEFEDALASVPEGKRRSLKLHLFVVEKSMRSNSAKPSLGGDGDYVPSKVEEVTEAAKRIQRTVKGWLAAKHAAKRAMQLQEHNERIRSLGCDGKCQLIPAEELKFQRRLGGGAFGEVFLASWHGVEVAVKRLNPLVYSGAEDGNASSIADFMAEARLLASLHHPNIIATYGVLSTSSSAPDDPNSHAIVTEYMPSGSLKRALTKHSRHLDPHKRILLALDAARGMRYLHKVNIVHFDLKSDNLLLNLRDRHRPVCKVCDFGLSRVKHRTYVSGMDSRRGTLPWIAPEVLKTPDHCSEKVDVYSFGIVMWELWTAQVPYKDKDEYAIMGGIMLQNLRPEIPSQDAEEPPAPGWEDLMVRCWDETAESRPSFEEVSKLGLDDRYLEWAMWTRGRPHHGWRPCAADCC